MGLGPRRSPARHGEPVASLRIVAIGRARGPERELFDRYAGRLRSGLALTELPDGHGAPIEIKRREAASILAAAPPPAQLIALDQAGQAPGSEGLAERLDTWQQSGRDLVFAIGGAEGLDSAILSRASAILSLGPQTWPHLLARIMLAEQLYRAQSILAGHPYHRSGRP